MADWRQEIDALFKSQGFERKIPELSADDQLAIQEFQENIGKSALENFCDETHYSFWNYNLSSNFFSYHKNDSWNKPYLQIPSVVFRIRKKGSF